MTYGSIQKEKKTRTTLFKLGKKKILTNNVLLLEIDKRGLLAKKELIDINDMNKIKFSKNETTQYRKKTDFIYSFLSSLRQKINDPLGKRKK